MGSLPRAGLPAVAVLLLVSCFVGAQAQRTAANTVAKVYFKLSCNISHSNNDDALLFPGQKGKSHKHQYFGSKIVDAYTKRTTQLLKGGTSCNPPGANSGYWIPALYLYNKLTKKYEETQPRVITVYYFNRYHGNLKKTVEYYPNGLKLICGNAYSARPEDTPLTTMEWFCSENNHTKYHNFPPKCTGLVMGRIYCPSCWDGRLTSPDHRSHMAYINHETMNCPASHPRRLPRIHVTFTYNFQGTHWPRHGIRNRRNPPLAKLSTKDGGGWQFHMDLWEAWDRKVLQDRMENCYYKGLMCNPWGKHDHRG